MKHNRKNIQKHFSGLRLRGFLQGKRAGYKFGEYFLSTTSITRTWTICYECVQLENKRDYILIPAYNSALNTPRLEPGFSVCLSVSHDLSPIRRSERLRKVERVRTLESSDTLTPSSSYFARVLREALSSLFISATRDD